MSYLFNGNKKYVVVSESTDTYTLKSGDEIYLAVDNQTVKLPNPSDVNKGREYNIKLNGTYTNGVLIKSLDGNTTYYTINKDYGSAHLVSNGSTWLVLADTLPVSQIPFSINTLTDVDTATTPPTSNQVLSWNGTNWIPATPSGGGTRPTITDKTADFVISTPSASLLQEIYTVSGSSAVTMTLPDATACTGMRYDIKRLGTATVTVACNGVQTIDGQTTILILAQYASITVISNGSNWIIL